MQNDTTNIHIHGHSLSLFAPGTSMKRGGVKLDLCHYGGQTSPLCEIIYYYIHTPNDHDELLLSLLSMLKSEVTHKNNKHKR
jgi:hypothetical protein